MRVTSFSLYKYEFFRPEGYRVAKVASNAAAPF
jgi:hypothetical protein